jgi:hypothetical protein
MLFLRIVPNAIGENKMKERNGRAGNPVVTGSGPAAIYILNTSNRMYLFWEK